MSTRSRPSFRFVAGSVLLLALAGCHSGGHAPTAVSPALRKGDDAEAVALLGRAMDAYAAMPSFQADCDYTMKTSGFPGAGSKRTIVYERPNRFKVVSTNAMGFVQTSVSDGGSALEFDNMTGQPPRKEPAPKGIADATSMQMRHPMFCGTLLYQFFGAPPTTTTSSTPRRARSPSAAGRRRRASQRGS